MNKQNRTENEVRQSCNIYLILNNIYNLANFDQPILCFVCSSLFLDSFIIVVFLEFYIDFTLME